MLPALRLERNIILFTSFKVLFTNISCCHFKQTLILRLRQSQKNLFFTTDRHYSHICYAVIRYLSKYPRKSLTNLVYAFERKRNFRGDGEPRLDPPPPPRPPQSQNISHGLGGSQISPDSERRCNCRRESRPRGIPREEVPDKTRESGKDEVVAGK